MQIDTPIQLRHMGRARARVYRQSRKMTKRRSRPILTGFVIGVIIFGVVVTFITQAKENKGSQENAGLASEEDQPIQQARVYQNELEAKVITELDAFDKWLDENEAKGFVGELGWPAGAGQEGWVGVADLWYKVAAEHGLWATVWATGSWWGSYPMTVYADSDGGERVLDTANPQAEVLEKFLQDNGDSFGINMAGMEFGSGLTSENPGTAGTDYFYEPAASFKFLAERGVKIVRLPFRWERIQPELGGVLKQNEIDEIRKLLDAAGANGIKVILDLHNYGEYRTDAQILKLGSGISHENLVDVWERLSHEFKSHSALMAYGLMNEPHDLPSGTEATPARNWEVASQKVVTALRDKGDDSLVMVAGYDWSSLPRWATNHPKSWIDDPSDNFRYEAHHYWDSTAEGFYPDTFQTELTRIQP